MSPHLIPSLTPIKPLMGTQANPDFWVMLLWKRLMGDQVLQASTDNPNVRVYAHSTAGRQQAAKVSVMLINVANTSTQVSCDSVLRPRSEPRAYPVEAYFLTPYLPSDLGTQRTHLNGEELRVTPTGQVPVTSPQLLSSCSPTLTPYSVTFLVI